MIELSDGVLQALDATKGPLQVVDPRNHQQYVLLPADEYAKLTRSDDGLVHGAYALMDEVARKEGWDDPEWDSYDVYSRRDRP